SLRELRTDDLAAGEKSEEREQAEDRSGRRIHPRHRRSDDDDQQHRPDVGDVREVPPQRLQDHRRAHALPRKIDSRSVVRRRTSMTPAPAPTIRATSWAISSSDTTVAVTTLSTALIAAGSNEPGSRVMAMTIFVASRSVSATRRRSSS